ncbi:MAG: hypothetical protein RLZ51_1848 [Pseudomonadota bacterium]
MTTTTLGAGDIDSVAMSLLSGQNEDDQTEVADDAAQADADTQADDVVDEANDPAGEDDGDAVETDETADEDDGGEEPTQSFRVKVDGQEVEVTLDDLKRSFAGQGYIQKRMQEVAAVRREAETVYNALNQERAELAQALAVYQQQLSAAGNPQPPSRELLKTDPIAYLEQEAAYREGMEQRQALAQQQAFLMQQQSEQQARAYKAYLAEQAQLLTQRIPDFADAKKAGELKRSLIEAGSQHYGFTPEELQGVSDARHVQVLHDAMRYRQLMAGKERVQEKVAQVNRPVVRPGAKRPETTGKQIEAKKAMSRMKSTGSVDDVAAFLLKG